MRVWDTNAILNLLQGRVQTVLEEDADFTSIICEIELLSGPFDESESLVIQDFLRRVTVLPICERVKTEAVRIRKVYRLKLPDALIAATAIVHQAKLVTNDLAFDRIAELEIIKLSIKPIDK